MGANAYSYTCVRGAFHETLHEIIHNTITWPCRDQAHRALSLSNFSHLDPAFEFRPPSSQGRG